MDGWVNGRMDGRRINRWVEGCEEGRRDGRKNGRLEAGRKVEGGNEGGEEGRKFGGAAAGLQCPRPKLCSQKFTLLSSCLWLAPSAPPAPPRLCPEAPPHRSLWVTSVLSWVPMEPLRSREQGHRFTVVRTHRSGEKSSHVGDAATPRTAPTALPPRGLHQAPEGPPLSPEPHCPESPPSIHLSRAPIPTPFSPHTPELD